MKVTLLLTLFILFSCSHGDLKQQSHVELTDFVMQESLLTTALNTSAAAALNCIRPFKGNLPKPVFSRLMLIIEQHFKYDEMYNSIREGIISATERKQMLGMAEELDGQIWKKFLVGIQRMSSGGDEKYRQLYESLEERTFDLETRRSELVAKVTDHAFMVNLVNLSNSQVIKMMNADADLSLTEKQKKLIKWIRQDLDALNDVHIKSLFTSAYLSTEDFSLEELEELLRIRSHDILKLSKSFLEQEISQRYSNFFQQIEKLSTENDKESNQQTVNEAQ
jgi:hypothetical protein